MRYPQFTSPLAGITRTLGALLLLGAATSAHTDIITPNGGEVLSPGATVTVQWEILIAHGQNDWDLWYSTTGGSGPWIPIATNLAPGSTTVGSVHTFDWVVPDTPSANVFVRVRMDNSGTDYYGYSDSALNIVAGVPALPSGWLALLVILSLGVGSLLLRRPSHA